MSQSVLQRIAAGNPAAIGECIDEYGSLVWSVARRFSRTRADAEDATQEVFLSIWQSARCFNPLQGSARTFIATIARRRLIDRLRKTMLEPPMVCLEALDTIPALRTHTLTSAIEAERIASAFAAVRADHRVVLELSLLQGLTQSEIASLLQMPLGTVKSFLRRGLAKIRDLMNARFPTKGVIEGSAPRGGRLHRDLTETLTATLGRPFDVPGKLSP